MSGEMEVFSPGEAGGRSIVRGTLMLRRLGSGWFVIGAVGAFTSIAIGDGHAMVAYQDRDQGALKFAYEKKAGDWATMVVDDRSRIVDLGKLEWSDDFALPDLPAYDKPTREEPVEATIGHIYYVHTADRNSDHYALFLVEEMNSGVNVSITWKLLGKPSENPK